jgi:hypothetical protein
MSRVPNFYNTDVATEHYLGIRWPRAIWQAVLEQAIRDALEGPSPEECPEGMDYVQLGKDLQAAARHWIADTVNEPRRFEWVCEQLGLEPSAVRRSIQERQR